MSKRSSRGKQSEEKNCPPALVTKEFCDERTKWTIEKIEQGFKELGDKIEELKGDRKESKKEKNYFWYNLVGTVVGGSIVALIVFVLSLAH